MINLLAFKEARVTWIDDIDLLQHLTHNYFNMFVVYEHALQTINFLNFIDEIGCKFFNALDGKNIMWGRIAVDDIIALFDNVTILKMDVFAFRDKILDGLGIFLCRDNREALFVFVIFAKLHFARDFCDDRMIFRSSRFKQFSNAR